MTGDFAILKDRSVLALFSARSVSLLGNAITPIALAFTVLHLPGGSPSMLGVVLAARLLSQVMFVLLGGAFADRWPKLRVMISADIGAGLTQGVAATLVITGHATPWILAGFAALSGAATAIFEPASRSAMPQLVSNDALQSANALLKLSMRGGSILGAALGGVLVSTMGADKTMLVPAGTFLLSALLLLAVRITNAVVPAKGPALIQQIRDGWKEFTAKQWVWVMVSQLAFVNVLLAGSFYVLGPVVADKSLGGASAWSTVLVAQAAGFVVGSGVAMKIRPRRPAQAAALLTMGFPLSVLLMAAEAPLAAIAVATFLAGVCIDVYEVTLDTALQKHVPPEALSRVMSYESLGSFALVPLGMAGAGPMADLVGVDTALFGAAALIMLAGPAVLLLRSVRSVTEKTESDRTAGTAASEVAA
ncbi:MFS transporter [Streptomyces sp. NPDC054766]|uniref:MFS transporter n=1 Tax=Streptomyces rhizosphaerihabitans TaxID=1266770 RepID=UPI0021BFC831|nr:MFS transporter [Streptomyces rhizosphaerihabitans]MCT9004762.1 MFS transporter [Streptomyces rhizosphaerihabitans]